MTNKWSGRFDGTIAGLKVEGRFTLNGNKDPDRLGDGPVTGPTGSIQFTQATATVAEDAGFLVVTLQRTGGTFGTIGVSVVTTSGTAIADTDFRDTNWALQWLDGDATDQTISIPIDTDTETESTEQFTLNLSADGASTSAMIGVQDSMIITITDVVPPAVTLPPYPDTITIEGFGGVNIKTQKDTVYAVTNLLNPTGVGGILNAPSDSYVVFPNGGDITIPGNTYNNRVGDRWFMGHTAPEGSLHLHGTIANPTGAALWVDENTDDVIWEHTKFRSGMTNGIKPNSHSSYDLKAVNGADSCRRIVHRNCSYSYGDDNGASAVGDVEEVSFIDCMFPFSLVGAEANYSFVATNVTKLSFIRSFFMAQARMPLVQNCGEVEFLNNVTWGNGTPGFTSVATPIQSTKANVEKNLFIPLQFYAAGHTEFRVSDLGSNAENNRCYIDSNWGLASGDDPYTQTYSARIGAHSGGLDTTIFTGVPKFAGYPGATLLEAGPLYDHVIANVGASLRRDALDELAISVPVNNVAVPNYGTIPEYGGYPAVVSGTAPQNIWKLDEVDRVHPDVKIALGLPGDADLTKTNYSNSGPGFNDFVALMHHVFVANRV